MQTKEPWHDKTNNVAVRLAKTQISLGIRLVWSVSSLSAWRDLGSLATHWAHSEDSDQTGQMPRLIWVFAGRTLILLVLSWGSSKILSEEHCTHDEACRVMPVIPRNRFFYLLRNSHNRFLFLHTHFYAPPPESGGVLCYTLRNFECPSVCPSVRPSVRPSAPTTILVSATPPTVLGQSFWNFTGVLRMVWRYAYCFFRILKLFFITFFPFLT